MTDRDDVKVAKMIGKVLITTNQSSDDTMLNNAYWTKEEDQELYEACGQYGNEWNLVSPYVGREKEECVKRWKSIIPDDWKSFSNFSWCDEDILLLIEAVRQAQKNRTQQKAVCKLIRLTGILLQL